MSKKKKKRSKEEDKEFEEIEEAREQVALNIVIVMTGLYVAYKIMSGTF